MPIVIRHAERADYAAIEAIEHAADSILIERLRPDSWESAPTGAARAAQPGFLLLADEVISRSSVGFVQVLEVDDFAHLEQLSVLPSHGRQGYGRLLVEAALTEVRNRGYTVLTLRTYADVPWNAPFYNTCGFVESAPTTDFHRDLVALERELGLERHGRRIQMSMVL